MIYLDHAATTPLCEAAKKAIIEHLDDFGNPSSSHELGRKSRVLIEDARETIAKYINAEPNEIYFTSCGSEANTWYIQDRYPLASNIEHHSIKTGARVISDCNGYITPEELEMRIQEINETFWDAPNMISCMYVNNEIGVIQNIKDLAKIAHKYGAIFHTDAVQTIGHIPIDVKDIGCDMLSASGHKFGAPKGVGFLYVQNGTRIKSLINGGKQEQGVRGGTENILGIVSMAAALEDSVKHMDEHNTYVKYLRDKLLDKLLKIPGAKLNGSLENRACSNINIRFPGVSGAKLVTLCSLYGIYISSGSACNEGIAEPSHVLKAIGLTDEEALSSVRITIGYENTEEEIDEAAKIISYLVERIRNDNG